MFRRINRVEAAGQHSAGRERQSSAVGGPINSARQAGDDQEAPSAEFGADPGRKFQACRRSVPRTYDRNRWPLPDADLSLHVKQRRRGLNVGKERRIAGVMRSVQRHARLTCPFQLRLGSRHTRDAARGNAAAEFRKFRQSFQRGAG